MELRFEFTDVLVYSFLFVSKLSAICLAPFGICMAYKIRQPIRQVLWSCKWNASSTNLVVLHAQSEHKRSGLVPGLDVLERPRPTLWSHRHVCWCKRCSVSIFHAINCKLSEFYLSINLPITTSQIYYEQTECHFSSGSVNFINGKLFWVQMRSKRSPTLPGAPTAYFICSTQWNVVLMNADSSLAVYFILMKSWFCYLCVAPN